MDEYIADFEKTKHRAYGNTYDCVKIMYNCEKYNNEIDPNNYLWVLGTHNINELILSDGIEISVNGHYTLFGIPVKVDESEFDRVDLFKRNEVTRLFYNHSDKIKFVPPHKLLSFVSPHKFIEK